jgi:DNA-binding LytR/AlgR family response regulator
MCLILKLKVDREIYRIPETDIICIDAKGHYCHVRTTSEMHVVRMGIGELEEQLKKGGLFVRVHASHLANYLHIKKYKWRELLHFKTINHHIPITDAGFLALEEKFNNHNNSPLGA